MEEKIKELIEILTNKKETIATMESCTGGALASTITNIEGASDILKFSAITYSNEYKIKMGVPKKIIDTYSVYSIETAKEMSKQISIYANSNYGIGITGKLNRMDKNNLIGKDNLVFISIYEKNQNTYTTISIEATKESREENKKMIVSMIIEILLETIKK